jgi:hypothetical protein
MRTTTFVLSLGFLLAAATSVSATTCAKRAQYCMKNGGTKATCYEAARMAACKKSGVYYGAYSGKAFEAKDR